MTKLNIATATALGPLTVEVIGPRGERVGKPLTLSSLRQEADIEAEPGDYTVVATRPSGEQLFAPATVGPQGGRATLEMAGRSPREFLIEAANLGLTYAPTAPVDDFRLISVASPRAANTASRSMSVLLGKDFKPDVAGLSLTDRLEETGSGSRSADYHLMSWRYSLGKWSAIDMPSPNLSEDFLQVHLDNYCTGNGGAPQQEPIAIGMLGQDGFGPIVIVPPFRQGVDLTFLAAGVAMPDSADREANPSAVRVPVALAVPRDPGLADLLIGLNAPVLPNASAIWEAGRGSHPEQALMMLAEKFEDPAAAVLGALFLARFAPSQVPISWLRNLNGILPDVADTWLLLAWMRVTQGDGKLDWDMSVTQMLRRASQCRCVYFSRTRFQLAKLSYRYGPLPRARQEEVQAPRRARTGDYLNFAADAGGLEAFWGYSPTRPGMEASYPVNKPNGPRISMRKGKFVSLN